MVKVKSIFHSKERTEDTSTYKFMNPEFLGIWEKRINTCERMRFNKEIENIDSERAKLEAIENVNIPYPFRVIEIHQLDDLTWEGTAEIEEI